MEKTEMEEFSRSLWDSLAVANRKLIEEKAERGEKLVYSTPEGKIYHIEAQKLLEMLEDSGEGATTTPLVED
ncbi:MAG: hypothetical protein IJ352_04815 [Muribaculaceae bacterium]|nr:hypothetical protein [Muribaculaceae bacterium]MBQ7854331.1 hypothetical protein [Muribaculaceae bacterium]